MAPTRALAVATGLAAAGVASASAPPPAVVHVHTYAVGGRRAGSCGRRIPLAGVAVRITTASAPSRRVAEARTGPAGLATIRLRAGEYVLNAYLTPPAVVPQRRCEAQPWRLTIRHGGSVSINIVCPIR